MLGGRGAWEEDKSINGNELKESEEAGRKAISKIRPDKRETQHGSAGTLDAGIGGVEGQMMPFAQGCHLVAVFRVLKRRPTVKTD